MSYLRELCDEHGIVLVADEIQSGIGRTGKMFAMEHFGIDPDLTGRKKYRRRSTNIGSSWESERYRYRPSWRSRGTFGGNPMAVRPL